MRPPKSTELNCSGDPRYDPKAFTLASSAWYSPASGSFFLRTGKGFPMIFNPISDTYLIVLGKKLDQHELALGQLVLKFRKYKLKLTKVKLKLGKYSEGVPVVVEQRREERQDEREGDQTHDRVLQ